MKRDKIVKKITNVMHFALCISAASLLLTSCTFEQDDYFDETAALRVTHINNSIKKQLVDQSAEGKYGWVIQYFVSGTDDYDFEGFNLFGRFYDDNKVTLASNHRFLRNGNANKYTEHTSTFKMLAEEGPVLSFDTWNDILTVFEDPVDPTQAPGTIANNGEGMFGDHNLVLSAFKDDEVLFRGERHRAEIRFIPCDRPWTDYMAAVTENKNHIATSQLPSYYVTNGTDTLYFSGLYKGVFVYGERLVDPLKKKTLSCVFTPQGFRINHVDSIGENVFQEFTIAEDKSKLLSEDGNTQVIACWDNYLVAHTAIWPMDETLFTAEQKALFNQIDAAAKVFNSAWSLASIGIGKSTGSNAINGLVLTFYTNTSKTKTNTAGVALTMTRPAFGKIQIDYSSENKVDKNMESIVKKSVDMEKLARAFAATLNGTYDVVPNDYFLPTGAQFNAAGGGTTFKLN